MPKIEILKREDDWYELEKCPFSFKFPLACQVKGCPYWKGYVFKDVYHMGFKDYISSSWRKMIHGNVEVASFVKCNFFQKDEENAGV